MNQKVYDQAVDFIWRNARLLEKHRFAYHFMNGPKSAVLTSLRAYQNLDGGFGNALEPDKRYPGSNAIDIMTAFYILDEIEAMDHPMVTEACDYLLHITAEEGGLPFSIPQMKAYPHAPWWSTDNPNPPASINPTGDITGLLLKNKINHPWLEKAIPFCWEAQDPSREGYHEIMPAVQFLTHAPDPTRAGKILEKIKTTIKEKSLVAFDRTQVGYIKFPIDWVPEPDHPFCTIFSDQEIETDLDALITQQKEDGGWPINWPPISPTVELEWRGIRTLEALLILRAYQKLS